MNASKIIKGVVGGGRYTVTAPIIKEDYGLYLQIEGVELPDTYEVDFSNDEYNGTSITMIGDENGVLIPSQFIATGKDVFAFLYHVGADFGRTIYKFRIPNKVRPDRTDETPTPEEQSTIDQAISALNEAVEQTAQNVTVSATNAQSALNSAFSASADADRAEQARDDAQTYANNASASASQASASATASAQSASDAETARQATTSLVAEAQGYANASEQSATASANSAEQAESAKGVAQSYAQDAQTSATYASLSESTASTKASEASGYASTASQKATEASQSASQASGYAQTAESAKTDAQTAQGKAEDAQTAAETAQGLAEDAQEAAETAAASVSASAAQIATNTADIADLQTDVAQNEADILKAFPTDTASGAVASFPDGADDIPLKSLIVNIDPVQDLSNGDPSPENICPISGWTGCEIKHTGKNLLPLNIWNGFNYNSHVGTVFAPTLSDKSWTQGENSITYETTATYTALSLMTPLLHKGVYYISLHKLSANSLRFTRYVLDKSFTVKQSNYVSNVTNASVAITLDEDGYIAFHLDNSSTASQTVEVTIQVEVGDTETAYEPYQGQTIPISWQTEAGTVYGGKLDVLSGVLTVEKHYGDLSGASIHVQNDEYKLVKKAGFPFAKSVSGGAAISNVTNEFGNISSSSYNSTKIQFPTTGTGTIFASMPIDFDVSAVTFCYELATPIEIQLTPHEVSSLLGQNNIFADTGDTSAEYRADTKLYISRLTEPDADMIADANIVSGQYFMVGNNLYKATANIASGAQVIVGTNATRKSLAQALNEINA